MLFELTGFQRDILHIINGHEKPSGQEIKNAYEKGTDSETTHGRMYSNLNTLVKKGFVEKGNIDDRTNYYSITGVGKRMIKEQKRWEDKYIDIPKVAN